MPVISVKQKTYDELDKLRHTDKGTVSFDAIIIWLIEKAKPV